MSVETKQIMLGFAFFFFFFCMAFWGFFVSFFSFCKPLFGPFMALQQLLFLMLLVEQLQAALCFKKRIQQGSSSPCITGCFPVVLPGEGDGVLLCHTGWGSDGGKTGCWSWGEPGAFRDCCKAIGCFGVLARAEVDMRTKAVPIPGYS